MRRMSASVTNMYALISPLFPSLSSVSLSCARVCASSYRSEGLTVPAESLDHIGGLLRDDDPANMTGGRGSTIPLKISSTIAGKTARESAREKRGGCGGEGAIGGGERTRRERRGRGEDRGDGKWSSRVDSRSLTCSHTNPGVSNHDRREGWRRRRTRCTWRSGPASLSLLLSQRMSTNTPNYVVPVAIINNNNATYSASAPPPTSSTSTSSSSTLSSYHRLGDQCYSAAEKINSELLSMTYGAMVTQLIKDYHVS